MYSMYTYGIRLTLPVINCGAKLDSYGLGAPVPGGDARGRMTPGTHTKSEVAVPGVNPGWYLHCLWWSPGGLRGVPPPGLPSYLHHDNPKRMMTYDIIIYSYTVLQYLYTWVYTL